MAFLNKVKQMELKIDEYLDLVSESGILFAQIIAFYNAKKYDLMCEKCEIVRTNERTADEYRIEIEQHLYKYTLIPENRGDVLSILENTDKVINQIKLIVMTMSIEKPEFADSTIPYIELMVQSTANAVEELIKAVRAFFHNFHLINDYTHKVFFYEKEVDDYSEKLRKEIFDSKIDLTRKLHLKQIIYEIEMISDYCQSVCDRLIIYSIKRQL
ncbi:MAG TPA: DUF47 family protein [Candidatus Cloacimonadota bacterium]|nr:DUF47 family protein [Candidatus Cloacimonadota bacterium]HQB40660.1 DUF47 family protein [Candidatus Cloacimonadota bacterium]